MTITAEAVKQLRERTGAGMMECKKALVESAGNLDAAADLMRRQGLAKADKKAARVAAEGLIVVERSSDGLTAAIVEVNCETDFVAREHSFRAFAALIGRLALKSHARDVAELLGQRNDSGETLEEHRRALVAKIGENINVRRVATLTAPTALGTYVHGMRIGVLVALNGGNDELAKDLAMHIAAANPQYIQPSDVPADIVDRERGILRDQAAGEGKGKTPEILGKMVEGRLRKYLNEIALTGQPFVKDQDVSVEKLLKQGNATVTEMVRFEVGLGLEKKQGDGKH
jgi:elongation factor Ts